MSIQTKGKARKIVSPPRMVQCPARAPQFLTCWLVISDHLGPASDAQEAQGNRQEQRKKEQGNGGALGQVAACDPGIECEATRHLGSVVRPAPSEIVDDDHIGEREDQAEEQRHQADRKNERQWYLKGMAPEAGAVD